jgi:hypothetical protein
MFGATLKKLRENGCLRESDDHESEGKVIGTPRKIKRKGIGGGDGDNQDTSKKRRCAPKKTNGLQPEPNIKEEEGSDTEAIEESA